MNPNLSGVQFRFREAYTGREPGMHNKHVVRAMQGDRELGSLDWHTRTGTVTRVHVEPEARRQGLATGMWNHALEQAGRPGEMHDEIVAPQHSDILMPDGAAWIAGMERKRR